ncbi:hypothetical protein I6J22_06915 [Corynebacterium kroppenstedtii]|uniref:Uncharacterized protein n=1 Tax=Corynebacterium kroppenstedtii (strain DSM 44385 / JCM 11950 / CIP 105744 / CCUG 35717) TaxID=645127 RepID=C4LLN6_CORK4|nr:hypothetical protein [Corynebacterium kroppenstedtii]ACR18741.1 hypothetical protein ckrop_2037 [Corynebacterium kroppenstedtii DSM 44385]QRP09967.1 hypothetical protein I6J22_06915 [Corynebacterium kroppenstedtii]
MGRHANKHARSARDESNQRWFTNHIEQADFASQNDADQGESKKNSRRYSSHQSTSRGGRQVTVAELLARGKQGAEAPSTSPGTSSTTTTRGKKDSDARGRHKAQDKSAPHTPRTLSPEESGAPQRYIPERARSASSKKSTTSPTSSKKPPTTPASTTEPDKRTPTPPSPTKPVTPAKPSPTKPAASKKPDTSDSHVSRRPSGSRPAKSSVPVGPSKRRRHSVAAASIGVGVVACALFGGTFAAWQSGVLGTPGASNSHHTASNTADDQNGDETGGGDGNKQGGSTHQQGDGEPKGDQEVRLSTIKNRPTTAPLPDDAIPANAAAIQDDEAGQFNLAYTGSDSTPAAFAVATRRVFAQQYVKTLNTNMTVDVKSPVSGRNIAMNCRDNGGFVTCEGPDDERVYIQ